jgi:hypothetical protein
MPNPGLPILALLLTGAALPLPAQNSKDEFWPELAIYANRGQILRFVFIDSFDQDQSNRNQQGSFAYYVDVALKPVFRRELRERGDVFRRRYLTFRAGYQYTTTFVSGNPDSENRIIAESTSRYHLGAGFVASDRNRGEFRWIKAKPFSMRYRNKLMIERDCRVRGFGFTPFVYAEAYYDTRYAAWNRNRLAFGVQIPAGVHMRVDPYLARQQDTRATPRYVHALGLTWNLFF